MKTNVLLAIVSGACLIGCAQQPQTQTTANDPGTSTYNRNQLMNTGRQDAAGQVEAIDPAVTVRR
jgi:hypothetical protein